MSKFTINSKELQNLIKKVSVVINKRSNDQALKRLYFSFESDNTLSIFGTDSEHFVQVKSSNVYGVNPGTFSINIEDVKIIANFQSEITMECINDGVRVSCGNISTLLHLVDFDQCIVFPTMSTSKKLILLLEESWLLQTITDLSKFVGSNEDDK